MEKQQIKQLKKAYEKKFIITNKAFFKSKIRPVDLFVEYLTYLRDMAILSTEEDLTKVSETNLVLTTLTATIAEFRASKCDSQKDFHWKSFCALTAQNMKDWLEMYDSI